MKPWWQREPAIAWALILFFPLGLWLMWKHASWRPAVKWSWTATIAAVLVIFIVAGATGGGGNNQSTAQARRVAGTTTAAQAATPVQSEPTRDSSIVTETPAPVSTPTPEAEVDTEADTTGVTPVTAAASSGVVLPDPRLTPGDVFSVGAAEVCVSGYSSSVRNVSTSTKNEVYTEYHIASHVTGQYEVDHLIPLELGGSNSIKNLWPEPAEPEPGFHQKDLLENKLHALVCAGSLDLATAQHAIATNWYAAYVVYELGDAAPPAPPPQPPAPTSAAPATSGGVTFTSVVGGPPGGHASVTVTTTPGANCTISYITPAGTHSAAQGLIPKTADGGGTVTWTWNIGSNTRPGPGTVTVNCGGTSATTPIAIE